jgi:restriction endonuclease S subunit
MIHYWHNRKQIRDRIFIPKYYDPSIESDLLAMEKTHSLFHVRKLVDDGVIAFSTGHEIGKLAYGTGDIPFVRTSDISNWEIKSSPKQGVSEEIYYKYAAKQDIQEGDILLVRDGTYLIGTNCIVTALDRKILFQSHILKIRVRDPKKIDPYLLFLSLNSPIVQRQIRSVQFTADTIDTIGSRYLELTLPIPKKKASKRSAEARKLLDGRERGRAFIIQAPTLLEEVLAKNSTEPVDQFLNKSWDEILLDLKQETVTAEFGHFEVFWHSSRKIKERVFLPKYYDPEIGEELKELEKTCDCRSIGELVRSGTLVCSTGDEIGKMAYGTGSIPFVRTSDFSNWELKYDPKQGISQEIYDQYFKSQDVRENDILLVRDGTYLIGNSCIITEKDVKMLYCGGLYKIRSQNDSIISPWLLLGLLNSYIVKRQIRTKQFTRDVIDTLGKRLFEVVLPIPKSSLVRQQLSEQVKKVVLSRVDARRDLKDLSAK